MTTMLRSLLLAEDRNQGAGSLLFEVEPIHLKKVECSVVASISGTVCFEEHVSVFVESSSGRFGWKEVPNAAV